MLSAMLSTQALLGEMNNYSTEELLLHVALYDGWELMRMPDDNDLYIYNKKTNRQFAILPYDKQALRRVLKYHNDWNQQVRLWSIMKKNIEANILTGTIQELKEYIVTLEQLQERFYIAIDRHDFEFGLYVIAAQIEFLSEQTKFYPKKSESDNL